MKAKSNYRVGKCNSLVKVYDGEEVMAIISNHRPDISDKEIADKIVKGLKILDAVELLNIHICTKKELLNAIIK